MWPPMRGVFPSSGSMWPGKFLDLPLFFDDPKKTKKKQRKYCVPVPFSDFAKLGGFVFLLLMKILFF